MSNKPGFDQYGVYRINLDPAYEWGITHPSEHAAKLNEYSKWSRAEWEKDPSVNLPSFLDWLRPQINKEDEK